MKTLSLAAFAILLFASVAVFAQVKDTTAAPAPAPPPSQTTSQQQPPPQENQAEPKRVFYGGTVGASFGSYFSLSIEPWIGYHIAPSLTGGLKFIYEYVRDESYNTTYTSSNYGGSVWANYQFHPRIYFHSEFEYVNYGYSISASQTERTWVPFLYLGGGVIQPISPSASAYVEVSFDVIQDSHSPYKSWSPSVSAGVAVGL